MLSALQIPRVQDMVRPLACIFLPSAGDHRLHIHGWVGETVCEILVVGTGCLCRSESWLTGIKVTPATKLEFAPQLTHIHEDRRKAHPRFQ